MVEPIPYNPSLGGPTLMQVVRNDPFAHVLGWMTGFIAVMPVAIFFFAKLDDSHPRESWTEIFGGVALLVLFGVTILRLRTRALDKRLATLPRVVAELLRYIHAGQWVNFRVRYRWEDRTLERTLMVPHGKYSARLSEHKTLTLAVVPTHPRRVTIVDLYVSDATRP
jgi:hypothetical protein